MNTDQIRGGCGVKASPVTTESVVPGESVVSQARLRSLLESQGYKCALTGVELTPATAACDHIVPVSRGGQNRIENVQIVTADVNRAKGSMTNDEFVAMCAMVLASKTKGTSGGRHGYGA